MDVKDHYTQLYNQSVLKIKTGHYQTDPLIDSKKDNRRGITLVIRPNDEIKEKIQKLLTQLKKVTPQQYFYPSTDIHITVMSIISCYNGFNLSKISIDEYIEIIQKGIKGFSPFNIDFRGLTASPSCIMIQGFNSNNVLNQIRDNLRSTFQQTTLEQSFDKRYTLQTAHSTILRFRKELQNIEGLLKFIKEYRNYYFGTFKVDEIELVYNDWYQRKQFVKQLHLFKL